MKYGVLNKYRRFLVSCHLSSWQTQPAEKHKLLLDELGESSAMAMTAVLAIYDKFMLPDLERDFLLMRSGDCIPSLSHSNQGKGKRVKGAYYIWECR